MDFSNKVTFYKDFEITRECVGRSGTSYQYSCGIIIARRKKDVLREIDKLIDDLMFIELQLCALPRKKKG